MSRPLQQEFNILIHHLRLHQLRTHRRGDRCLRTDRDLLPELSGRRELLLQEQLLVLSLRSSAGCRRLQQLSTSSTLQIDEHPVAGPRMEDSISAELGGPAKLVEWQRKIVDTMLNHPKMRLHFHTSMVAQFTEKYHESFNGLQATEPATYNMIAFRHTMLV
eukprot:g2737.t1